MNNFWPISLNNYVTYTLKVWANGRKVMDYTNGSYDESWMDMEHDRPMKMTMHRPGGDETLYVSAIISNTVPGMYTC